MPDGKPRWIRCYDNDDKTADRYTVVYTRAQDGLCHYIGMSASPFHPQGIGQHGESDHIIDRPGYSHLGRPITFDDLPTDYQTLIMNDYRAIWNL